MPRTPHATDFSVDVDHIGRFTFARRTIGDQCKIRGRYHQLTDGFYDADGNMADIVALAFVVIQTLLVSAPEGFTMEKLDPLTDDDCETNLLSIWKALRIREGSFRQKPDAQRQTAGPGDGAHVPAVVPG